MRCFYCPAEAMGTNVVRTDLSTDLVPVCGQHLKPQRYVDIPSSLLRPPVVCDMRIGTTSTWPDQ